MAHPADPSSLSATAVVPVSAAKKWRARAVILTIGLATFGFVGGFYAYSSQVVAQHEARVIAGDFPFVQLVSGKVTIEDGGKVIPQVLSPEQKVSRYVASTRLIPVGEYEAVLIAHDEDAKHLEKSEMVIGAQDATGAWHPASAAQVLERLKKAKPGSAQ